MLRRLSPLIATLLAMLLDTAVIPILYHGTYTFPLTLVIVLCIGLLLGRLRGLLFGMIGGVLIDISTGTLGMMTFFFMAAGFLVALIVDETNDRRMAGVRFHLRRGGVSFAMYMLGEIVFGVYRYFLTAAFEWIFVQHMVLRSLMVAVLVGLFCPMLGRLFFGRRHAQRRTIGSKREVKHF